MKKSFLKYLLILPAALWLLPACSRAPLPEAEGGRIPVRLSLALPDGQAVKSSLVTYGTDAVSSMWLLCFNQVGSCVDCIEATVSGSSITATPGIPRDSRSIHFIANKNLTSVKESVIGRQERNVLESITVSKDESVTFWGYFHGHTTAEVRDFVNAGSPATVYLLRDRAKLVGGTISDSNIDSIQWIVTRGLSEGYAVPYPYDNYYRLEGGRYYGNTAVTAKNGALRYVAAESDLVPFDTPLYLFDDDNTFRDLGNLVKIIVKVTYNDATVRFHNLIVMDEDFVTAPVIRSHTYTFNINVLPKNMGYGSFAEALAGEVFSNNYFVSIDRDVNEVTDGICSLSIDDPQGTHILYREGISKAIAFSYSNTGDPALSPDADDFHVMWLENNGLTASGVEPGLVYNPDNRKGAITFNILPVDATLHQGLLILQDTKNGLSRFIEVYAIDKFTFEAAPALEKVTGKSFNGHEVYKMTLTLPANFPACFLPINIPMASMTLSPYSDSSPDAASGTFTVSVTNTDDLNESNSVSAPYYWTYLAKSWDFWYLYSFSPDMSTPEGRTVTIYLEDVTSIRAGLAFDSVGLYLKMPRFGGIINDFDDALHLNK
ncbi:MAG: hypothetical protein J5917_01420 [Bacteroidales bacterium]|nr:hypothetical protein [Bacteroidales bacterium]